jgi:hypothetical protein
VVLALLDAGLVRCCVMRCFFAAPFTAQKH